MVSVTLDGVSGSSVVTSSGNSGVVPDGDVYTFLVNGYYTLSSYGADIWEISDDGLAWYVVATPSMLFMISGKVRVTNANGAPVSYSWIGYNPLGAG
jgi:hypothetical protein